MVYRGGEETVAFFHMECDTRYEHKQQPTCETTTASVRWKLAVKAKET